MQYYCRNAIYNKCSSYCKSIACAKINAVLAIINAVLQKYCLCKNKCSISYNKCSIAKVYIACAKIKAILLQKCYNKGSIAKVLQELAIALY